LTIPGDPASHGPVAAGEPFTIRTSGTAMRLQFVGSGDAFGSGGRLNTCLHVTDPTTNFLLDFGATSLVGLRQLGIERNAVDLILVTHFHADHFGGIPFFMLDAAFSDRRTRPLTIAGPPGLARRYAAVMDAAFPSYPLTPKDFSLSLLELEIGIPNMVGALRVTPFPVVHSEAAGPCVGYRIEIADKVLAYSGDTSWTESLVDIGREADLFVCECYTYEREVASHTNYATLSRHLDRIAPKRLILTHMSDDMLARRGDVSCETASDGLAVDF